MFYCMSDMMYKVSIKPEVKVFCLLFSSRVSEEGVVVAEWISVWVWGLLLLC